MSLYCPSGKSEFPEVRNVFLPMSKGEFAKLFKVQQEILLLHWTIAERLPPVLIHLWVNAFFFGCNSLLRWRIYQVVKIQQSTL